MFILEAELKDVVRNCPDFLAAHLHSGLTCACQGTEGHTRLQRGYNSHIPLPDWVTSMFPVCPPSTKIKGFFHKWAPPSFARRCRSHRQPDLCVAKTQWAQQASDHSPDRFRYDAGVATGFPCGKERKLDSCMLRVFGVVRMMRIKWSKTKWFIRLSLTDLFHFSGRASHRAPGRCWAPEDSMQRLEFTTTNGTVFLSKAELTSKVSVQPVATDTMKAEDRNSGSFVYQPSAAHSAFVNSKPPFCSSRIVQHNIFRSAQLNWICNHLISVC